MLRTIKEVAEICGVEYDKIASIIANENIRISWKKPYRLDEEQQTVIFMVLYYENRLQYLIFESKMNNPDFETYSRKEMIQKGLIIENNL
jgi:hypothetical protein